ncbi:YxlC family protein [Neobacillus sp. PS3-34]|uniref:YxlC family protein n=1 Tax=Neobacillus sp. PS3-34 TaxID=3070678 RepID=UPI0027DF7D28|nr:YxlC family protein [Neobacillus sp. PS3-34]WML49681.1 YxlC family protein [Neobacillus sp. PS3-34]
MKKQKVVLLENEQLNREDSQAISEINQGLESIDQFPVYTPDIQWFEQMIIEQKQLHRKKLIKDLTVFFIIALFILSGIVISLFNMPIIFILLQIIGIVFIASYTSLRLTKKVNGA